MIYYVRFDPESFLRDSVGWENEIKKYKKELNCISELKAIEQSAVQSSTTSDPVPMTASAREKVINEIERYEEYQRALKYGLSMLSEAQNEVLSLFFFKSGRKDKLVYDYGRKYGLGVKSVYAERRMALNEFARVITERYGL